MASREQFPWCAEGAAFGEAAFGEVTHVTPAKAPLLGVPHTGLDDFTWSAASPGNQAAMYGFRVARQILGGDLPTRRARKEFRKRHLELIKGKAQLYREAGGLRSAEEEAKFLESYRLAIALQLALPAALIDVRDAGV